MNNNYLFIYFSRCTNYLFIYFQDVQNHMYKITSPDWLDMYNNKSL